MASNRTPSSERLAFCMLALGREDVPPTIRIGEVIYHWARTVKHDFFAATAFYDAAEGERVVLKLGRSAEFFGVRLAWVGKWLCRREMRFYRALAEVPGVPRLLGTVGENGFVHAYVPGHPLTRQTRVRDGFFDALQEIFAELHRRGIAYVDANKSPNILVGEDGEPHLIDFQISWDLQELGDNPLNRWWLGLLQREDQYHLLKHKRRIRPDELTRQEREEAGERSALIRLHRAVFKPYFRLRRAMFKRLRESGRLRPETMA